MSGQNKNDIKAGMEVGIIKKEDQKSSTIIKGIIQDILTKSKFHPHGIKVRLTSGEIGRVKIIEKADTIL
jgi:uncharacterized repeat protein (TIGR03833 family)